MNALILATALLAAPAAQAPDTVTTAFAWPPGTVLSGQAVIQQVESQDGTEQPSAPQEISFTKTISAHPEGRRVVSAVESQNATAIPPYLVSEEGEFLGVDGIDEQVAQMREQFYGMVRAQTGGEVPPDAEAYAEQAINADVLELPAREEHTLLIGLWAGRTLDRNEVEFGEIFTEDPLTGSPVPTDIEYLWRGYAPCAEGEAPDSCVVLEVDLFPDADLVAPTLEQALTSQNEGEFIVNRAMQRRSVRILAQPAGLIPRRVEETAESYFEFDIDGEYSDLRQLVRDETRTYTVGGGLGN